MQLTFTQFFRPKWQHPKPGVRKKAVHNLNPEQASDQQILLQLARMDQDVEVRCSALEKLSNPKQLVEIANTDPTPLVKEQAIRQFCRLICNTGNRDPQEDVEQVDFLPLVVQLEDPDVLTHIALNAQHLEVQLKAVENIALESALYQLVINADNFQVRQSAARGISDPELLEQLIKLSRQKDKGVNRILRDARDKQKQQQKLQEQQNQQCESLCAALEKLAKEDANENYGARLGALLQRKHEIGSKILEQFQTRLQQLDVRCQSKLEAFQQQLAEQQQLQQQQQQRQDLLERLQQLVPAVPLPSQLDNLQQQWQQIHQLWQQLDQSLPADGKQQKSFANQVESLNALFNSLTKLQQFAELKADSLSFKKAQQTLTEIAWPAGIEEPQLVLELKQQIKTLESRKQANQQAKQQQQQACSQQLDCLEVALEEGRLQEAAPLIKQLNEAITKGGNNRGAKQRFQRLNAQYQELNNWQMFATQPKLEQLCQEMESLIHEELDGADRSDKLKAIQQQWREVSSSQIPRNLRNRFQKASQEAYVPCQVYFEEQKAVRQKNLEQRQLLVERLQQLIDNGSSNDVDFKALAVVSRELKQQWRLFTPVDRAPGRKLQNRFNELLKKTDQLLADDQQRNAELKGELLQQAINLLEQEDLLNAQNEAKALQKKWRDIGPAKRKQEQGLWRDFRTTCNQLFERKPMVEEPQQKEANAPEVDN
ncbi:MAG: DUF349 domain-containing protein, partial [Motiliproteus sp.]|nr:DUF349 domain-containing protein [Motiliproteus sp.]